MSRKRRKGENKENTHKNSFLKKSTGPLKKYFFKPLIKGITGKHLRKDDLRRKYLTIFLSFVWVISLSLVFVIIKNEKHSSVKKHSSYSTKTTFLQSILSESAFETVKATAVSNVQKPIGSCLTTKKTIGTIDDRYLVILKRGKLFLSDLNTKKYLSRTEISPVPKWEENTIEYDGFFIKDKTVFVVGKRIETQSLEISTFTLQSNGAFSRKNVYVLPADICYDVHFSPTNEIIFYTANSLAKTNFNSLNTIRLWDFQKSLFKTVHFQNEGGGIFTTKSPTFRKNVLHTVTTCQINTSSLKNCRQTNLITQNLGKKYFIGNHLYLWTPITELPTKKTLISHLFLFSAKDLNWKMLSLRGSDVFLQKNETGLTALVKEKGGLLKTTIKFNDFSQEGQSFLQKNKYRYLSEEFRETKNKEIFVLKSGLPAVIDKKTHFFTFLDKNLQTQTVNIANKPLLTVHNLSNEKTALFFKTTNELTIQVIDLNKQKASKSFVIANRLKDNDFVLTEEIKSLLFFGNFLVSVPIINQKTQKGNLYLLAIDNKNSLSLKQIINFSKFTQNIHDYCQNDCDETWLNGLHFLTVNDLLLITTGSYLKFFKKLPNEKLILVKNINYTVKPAPPKPPKPKAKIPGGAKVVNGKYVCAKKHDYVGKSKKKNKGYIHLDMECCLDPDEYPNPWCTYRPGELSVTKYRYSDYTGKRKKIKK